MLSCNFFTKVGKIQRLARDITCKNIFVINDIHKKLSISTNDLKSQIDDSKNYSDA